MQKRRVTLKPLGGYPSLLKKEDGKITFVIHFKTKKVAQLFFKSDRTFADSSFIDDLERLVSLVKKRNSKFCNQIEMKEWGKGFEETSDQTPITVTFVYNIISSNKYKFECSIAITKPDLDLISLTEMNDC